MIVICKKRFQVFKVIVNNLWSIGQVTNPIGVTYLVLFLHVCELLQLVAEPEGGQYGVITGQRHVGRAGQRPVRVQPRPGVLHRVKVPLVAALHTLTEVVVGLRDLGPLHEQELH